MLEIKNLYCAIPTFLYTHGQTVKTARHCTYVTFPTEGSNKRAGADLRGGREIRTHPPLLLRAKVILLFQWQSQFAEMEGSVEARSSRFKPPC